MLFHCVLVSFLMLLLLLLDLKVAVQHFLLLILYAPLLLLHHPPKLLWLVHQWPVPLSLWKGFLPFLLLSLGDLLLELLTVVILHYFTPDSLLFLHFFQNLLSLNCVFVCLPLFGFLLDQWLALILLKYWMRSVVYFSCSLLQFLKLLLSFLISPLLDSFELSQFRLFKFSLPLLKYSFSLLLFLHCWLEEQPEILFFLILLFLLIVH